MRRRALRAMTLGWAANVQDTIVPARLSQQGTDQPLLEMGMSRRSPKKSALRRTSRRASNRGPIVATVLGAAAVVGLIGYLAMRPVQSVQSTASTQVATPSHVDAS